MDVLERLQLRTGEVNEAVLQDCIESAYSAIMSRRYPYSEWPDEIEPQYKDLLFQCALALYNKEGAEFESSHSENGISRQWQSEGIPESLLNRIIPYCAVIGASSEQGDCICET